MITKSRIIPDGTKVIIKDKDSVWYDEWGTVVGHDEDGYYFVAIANDDKMCPEFQRSELKIVKST